MTFGADKEHSYAVLELLASYGFALRGYLRADLITKEFVKALKRGGFEFAQIGIEASSAKERKRLNKHISDSTIVTAFQLLHDEGIRVGAHFIVGTNNDSLLSAWKCSKMAKKIKAAYCSINLYKPRMGIEPLPLKIKYPNRVLSFNAMASMQTYNAKKYVSFMSEGLFKK